MPVVPFPVVGLGNVNDANEVFADRTGELGAYYVVRGASQQYSIVKFIRATDGFSEGEAAISDYATLKDYHVARAATADAYLPICRGIAAATIASGRCGYLYVAGYCPIIAVSHTTASGDGLVIGVSTAGAFSPNLSSSVLNATVGTGPNATVPYHVVAYAREIIATGHVGSAQICGWWG